MKIHILTVCPEMFDGFLKNHVVDRALRLGVLQLQIVDIREYADGCFRKVDDSPYGGGPGMILRIGPVLDAVEDVKESQKACTVALTPAGEIFSQQTACSLAACPELILICGHYEGMDARIYQHADRLISVGDYILSGGEIAAMAICDAVVRLLPGVLKKESLFEESFTGGLLEYPQYTRPADYKGEKVPEVLLGGDHGKIEAWRKEEALKLTRKNRPDLGQGTVPGVKTFPG